MATCNELVIYRLKPGRLADWRAARVAVARDLARLPGFLGYTSQIAAGDPAVIADEVRWSSRAAAMAAHASFREWPSGRELMAWVDEVIFSGHFTPGRD